MQLINTIQELLVVVQALFSHFVDGTAATATPLDDGEWLVTQGDWELSAKGNALAGALADIIVYGVILMDWVVQGLLGQQMPTWA